MRVYVSLLALLLDRECRWRVVSRALTRGIDSRVGADFQYSLAASDGGGAFLSRTVFLMANIQALRGVRFDLSRVGKLSDVVAPPYDVIDERLQETLYRRHPHNIVRLELTKAELNEAEENRYRRAGVAWRNWRREGILQLESRPAIYVYHQHFEFEGRQSVRRGFICRLGLERFGEGSVYPHEETHARAKQDRLHLLRESRANLSPILGLYEDDLGEVQELLESAIADRTPLEAHDEEGNRHLVWVVTDIGVISRAADLMGERAIFIADGHHRYETACDYRDELVKAAGGSLPAEHPANYALMACFGMSDPGLVVLPTHRLFRGVPPIRSAELIERLGEAFECEVVGHRPSAAEEVWTQIELEGHAGTIGLYTRLDDTWTLIRLTAMGSDLMDRSSKHSPEWNSLSVSLLHGLVLEQLLGMGKLPSPLYVRTAAEVEQAILTGDSGTRDATGQTRSGEDFQLAALVLPPRVEDVQLVSLQGERMPPKSTFFYPKLLTGLVMNPLD